MFSPMNTSDHTTSYRKCLLYGHHGWGKTTQFAHYQKHYGKGFIISGESGLSSIRSSGIDYLPFTSWGGETNPDEGKYSFRDIVKWIRTDDFKSKNYKWIGLDSLTELSDHSMKYANELAENEAKKLGKAKNGFEVYATHGANIIGACKLIRDLACHVLITALSKESTDDNGNVEYWAMVGGKATQQQLPGIFDAVFCGVRHTADTNDKTKKKVIRYVITDEVNGWKGKVRDEKRRLRPVEQTGNIVDLFRRMDMDDDAYEKWIAKHTQEEGDNNGV